MGVTTLELDTGATKDDVVVVTHERHISSLECQGPYVGKLIHELTYAQIQKLDCGTRHPPDPSTDPFVGTQEAVPGTHMPSLAQVFQLVNRYGADKVQFDIETKRDPTLPKETVGPTTSTKKVIAASRATHDQARGPSVRRLEHAAGRAQDQAAPAPRRAGPGNDDLPRHAVDRRHRHQSAPFDGDLARVVADRSCTRHRHLPDEHQRTRPYFRRRGPDRSRSSLCRR